MNDNLCPATVVDRDGYEQPCDREATGWCWYEGDAHEPLLYPACRVHENEGGRRMAEAEQAIARVREVVDDWSSRESWDDFPHSYLRLLRTALDGEVSE